VDSRCGGRFGLSRGAVGFSFVCKILHVLFLHEHNIVGLLFGEILCT
jgi:hypothetical protein